jgi:hypothetical protein
VWREIDHFRSISARFTEKNDRVQICFKENTCYIKHVVEWMVVNIIKEQLNYTNTTLLDKLLVSCRSSFSFLCCFVLFVSVLYLVSNVYPLWIASFGFFQHLFQNIIILQKTCYLKCEVYDRKTTIITISMKNWTGLNSSFNNFFLIFHLGWRTWLVLS